MPRQAGGDDGKPFENLGGSGTLRSRANEDVLHLSSNRAMAASKKREPYSAGKEPSPARLDEMIEEAIVDAYGESEQIVGFYTMLEDNLEVPFRPRCSASR